MLKDEMVKAWTLMLIDCYSLNGSEYFFEY